jgi:hypothetical protein
VPTFAGALKESRKNPDLMVDNPPSIWVYQKLKSNRSQHGTRSRNVGKANASG